MMQLSRHSVLNNIEPYFCGYPTMLFRDRFTSYERALAMTLPFMMKKIRHYEHCGTSHV